jgi:four helix bundle protein
MSSGSYEVVRDRTYDLEERLITFAVTILDLAEKMPSTRVGNHIAGQIIRSGTSPAPNYGEAQSAESRKDFIHKMKIALKELRETYIWLKIAKRKAIIGSSKTDDEVLDENVELIKIFRSSINTAEEKQRS